MKNRRTVIVAFLLVAVLTIGVGFANLTDTLIASGSTGVNVDDAKEVFDGDVYFSKTVMNAATGTATIKDGEGANDKGDIVEIEIEDGFLKEVGDQAVITLTVKSESDLAITMALPTITNSNPTYFSVTTTWLTEQQIAPKGTLDITITVELTKTPTTDQDMNFEIELGATSAAA